MTIPGVVQHGVVKTAANIDKSWIGCEIEKLLEDRLQHDVVVVNDADAAGVGELDVRRRQGPGTASSSSPRSAPASARRSSTAVSSCRTPSSVTSRSTASTPRPCRASSAKTREGLSYEEWAKRLQRYYRHLEDLLWPDLIVVGGGVSRKAEKFLPLLDLRTPIVPATLENAAGIIGAAVLATQTQEERGRHLD